jgi:hypothetical protein
MTEGLAEMWLERCGTLPHLPRPTLSEHPRHQRSSYQHFKPIMSDAADQPKKERFAPKEAVTLQPPKDDIIDRDHLAKCDGMPDSGNMFQDRSLTRLRDK